MIYYDAREDIEKGLPFNFIIGGRGIGKTYSVLRYHSIERQITILYLRTTEKELDVNVSKISNPYKKLNFDFKRNIKVEPGEIRTFYEGDTFLGYSAALTTFYNMRGLDFSDVDVIIWDEFMKKSYRKLKGIATAFLELYESICRNRELQGEEPVKVYLLSNAVTINSELLDELKLTPVLESMVRKGQRRYTDKERGVYIHFPYSDVSEEKKHTALYKLAQDSEYIDFALDNIFTEDSYFLVERKPLVEYKPVVSIDKLYIWKHKSESIFYVSASKGDCIHFTEKDSYVLFYKNWGIKLRENFAAGRIYFESFYLKNKFLDLVKWKN